MPFDTLGLSPYLVAALKSQNYTKPYPIQERAIPAILAKKDILGIAQTGSGKTACYVLPILSNLEGKPAPKSRHIQVLVLVPTRELAIQVGEVFKKFGEILPFRFKSLSIHGGVSINPQMQSIQHSNVLIATPGRLLELHRANAVHFADLDTLVLDEADKMLHLGFQEEMDKILDLLPPKRQNLLFSATLSPDIQRIQQVIMQQALVIEIIPEKQSLDLIQQEAYQVSNEKRGPLLRYLIKKSEIKQVLVFTSSIYQADQVSNKLIKNGIDARAIHSKKTQGNRKESLKDFKNGKLNVLVTTDLLARGIDIEFLPCVINYELPRSPKDFIHRIGRTGRAENPGKAITFVSEEDLQHFEVIQKKMKKIVEIIDSEHLNLHGF